MTAPLDTLVVGLDGSATGEEAIAPARHLAVAMGARLVLVTVPTADLEVDPGHYLDDLAEGLGVDAGTEVLDRPSAVEGLLEIAHRPGALLCLGTHGRSGLGDILLGSVAAEVLARADVPLLFVGRSADHRRVQPGAPLVVGLDGSERSLCVLPAVARVAPALGARAVVVEVTDSDVVLARRGASPELADVRRAARRLGRLGVQAQGDVVHDTDAAATLVRYASACGAPLLALASHGRTGLRRVLLGSVTARVLRDAPSPVLVVRAA